MKKLITLFFIVLIILALPVLFISYTWSKIFVVSAITPSSGNQTETSEKIEQHFDKKTLFSILLLGYGGGTHEGAYLTDSLLLVTINPAQKTITLLSIPRDLWVDFPNELQIGSHWKINAMYAIGTNNRDFPQKPTEYQGLAGGMNLAKFAVSRVTGLTVDRVMLVDFQGFKKSIDLLGGVDVDVLSSFDDYEYPIDGKGNDPCGKTKQELDSLKYINLSSPAKIFPCRYEHLSFQKGLQNFNGETALKFVRSRHAAEDGTDFGRSTRQREVLLAIKNKVESPTVIPKLIPMLATVSDYIKTDITIQEIQTLILRNNDLRKYTVQNIALTNEKYLTDSSKMEAGYVLIPKAGEDNWKEIQEWLKTEIYEESNSNQ